MRGSNERAELAAEAVMDFLRLLKNDEQLHNLYAEDAPSGDKVKRQALMSQHARTVSKLYDISEDELMTETAKALGRSLPINEDDYPSSLSMC